MIKILSTELGELRHVSLNCSCGISIMLDLSTNKVYVTHCPACHSEFTPHVQRDISALAEAYKHSHLEDRQSRKGWISFNIPITE